MSPWWPTEREKYYQQMLKGYTTTVQHSDPVATVLVLDVQRSRTCVTKHTAVEE